MKPIINSVLRIAITTLNQDFVLLKDVITIEQFQLILKKLVLKNK